MPRPQPDRTDVAARRSFTFAPAQPKHIDRLREIEVDAGEMFRPIGLAAIADDPPPTPELLHAHFADGTAWVAIDGTGRVVGYATASIVDGEAHLDQVSVERAASGHRVGAGLIEVTCEWARATGLSTITLTTFRDVPWNGPYYERLGFRPLPVAACGPQLAQILQAEHDAGIDVLPRIAMRRDTAPSRSPSRAPADSAHERTPAS